MMIKKIKPQIINSKLAQNKTGIFAEILRQEQVAKKGFGQISVAHYKLNNKRGNHYHKIRHEYFTVLSGKVKFLLLNIKTKKMASFILSEKKLQTLYIPPFWNHILTIIGEKDTQVLIYSTIPFEKSKPDVFTLT